MAEESTAPAPAPATVHATALSTTAGAGAGGVTLPRVAIQFCTQCRWMLRAAWYAQELLTTFGPAIGEVALVPATGGRFVVELTYNAPPESTETEDQTAPSDAQTPTPAQAQPQTVLLWDRKAEGGFPESKVLKQLVRDRIEPEKNLGHSDRKAGQES